MRGVTLIRHDIFRGGLQSDVIFGRRGEIELITTRTYQKSNVLLLRMFIKIHKYM